MNAPDTGLTGPTPYADIQDEYSWHELMDRCYMLTEILGTTIDQHPCAQVKPEIAKAITTAHDVLWTLYQTVADTRFELFPGKE